MTAVARLEPATPATIQWDQELRGMTYLLKSGLLPDTIRSAEAALFIVLTGRDLGMSPVQSLRSINIIKGKVEVSADAQLGLFHRNGGRSTFVTLTDVEAVLELRAPWLVAPHRESFSFADAQKAKLTGGENYQKYPKAMLRSRAITAGLKSIGFDATAGVYAPGELGGEAEVVASGEVVIPPTSAPAAESTLPSEKQVAFFGKLLKSHVWTDEERQAYQDTATAADRAGMSALIDEMTAEGKRRAAAEKAAIGAEAGDAREE
jgi:hypothetical protein